MAETQAAPPEDAPDLRVGDVDKAARENVREGKLAPRVFWPAAIIMAIFIGLTLAFPTRAKDIITALQSDVINYFGWYYVAIIAFVVVFALYLGFSRMGDVKLGNDDDEPAYSFGTWFAFLFAAGMGIGLVFYGATEPLTHFADPRPGVSGSQQEVAQAAMSQSFLHWGLHPWALYVIVGLAIAYAAHRLKLPLSIRYALKPLLGDRIKGGWGDLIDIVALVGTLFGVTTSLGLGVIQIAAGLGYINIPAEGNGWLTALIIVLMGVTLFSVVTGLEKGMKWLSNGNLILAAIVCIFVLVVGPTIFLLREFVGSIGSYLQNVIQMTFETLALYGVEGEQFQAAWTTFYWGWWISWSPFVGMFIARVSKGRSVREFVIGVLLVPALTSFFWFSVLGGTALHQELFEEGINLIQYKNGEATVTAEDALFQMFAHLPGGTMLTIGAVLLITIFFVTSADSGALVLGMISTNGSPEPKTWIRVFWVVVAALTAIALMWAGGSDSLTAIQTIAILTAIPFSLVIILMCISLYKALSYEHRLFVRAQRRNAREEIAEELHERIDERVDTIVASGVDSRVALAVDQAVGEAVGQAVDARVEAAVDEAVEEAVEARVEEAVATAVDDVALQVEANTAAIQKITDTQGIRTVSSAQVEADKQAKQEAQQNPENKRNLPWESQEK